MPPNLPRMQSLISSREPAPGSLTAITGRSRLPYWASRVAVRVEAPECSSQGFRRGVPTLSRSLSVSFQVTFLHLCPSFCSRWAYLNPILFFCQAERFLGVAKNFSGLLTQTLTGGYLSLYRKHSVPYLTAPHGVAPAVPKNRGIIAPDL